MFDLIVWTLLVCLFVLLMRVNTFVGGFDFRVFVLYFVLGVKCYCLFGLILIFGFGFVGTIR